MNDTMNTHTDNANAVTSTLVSARSRITTLPKHFGNRLMMRVEGAIYDRMEQICATYNGAIWDFYELSNGGFFMCPKLPEPLHLSVADNGSSAEVSAQAAGIVACLLVFSALSFETDDERIAQHFHWLRDFAVDHPEQSAIFSLID